MDRSSSVNKALMEQLEAIKADFYAFLSLFHPSEAAAAIVASSNAANMAQSTQAPLSFTSSSASRSAGGGSEPSPYKSGSSASASGGPARSPGSAASGDALVNKLASDMTDLKRRLEAFSGASQRVAASTSGVPSSSSSSSFRTGIPSAGSSGAAYMSRAMQADVRGLASTSSGSYPRAGSSSATSAIAGSSTLVGLGSTGTGYGLGQTATATTPSRNDDGAGGDDVLYATYRSASSTARTSPTTAFGSRFK
jgi:hypothetical protein